MRCCEQSVILLDSTRLSPDRIQIFEKAPITAESRMLRHPERKQSQNKHFIQFERRKLKKALTKTFMKQEARNVRQAILEED